MSSQLNANTIYEDFKLFLSRFLQLSKEVEEKILSISEQIIVKKGEHLFKEGDINAYYYFIQTGAAHLYSKRKNKRITTWIVIDHDFITTVDSLTLAVPTKENLEILENSTILRLHKDDVQRLFDESKEAERLGRLLISNYLKVTNEHLKETYFLTAKERYNNLINRYPEVLYRIPLGVIANYLGISQATLSRIRNPKYGKQST